MAIETRLALLEEFKAAYLAAPTEEHINEFLGRLVALVPPHSFECGVAFHSGLLYLIGALEETPDGVQLSTGEALIFNLQNLDAILPADKPITVVISSEGGDLDTGLAVISTIGALRTKGRQVNGHVAGTASSAAFDILQFCDHRSIEPFGGIMTHETSWGLDTGSTTEHENNARFSRKMEHQIYDILAKRTGKSARYYQDKVHGKEWYLNAQEALAEGLVDEIVALKPLPKSKSIVPKVRKARAATPQSPTPETEPAA